MGHFVPPGETDSGVFPPASLLWLQGWVSYRDIVSASSNDLFIFHLLMILVWACPIHLVYRFTQLVSTFLFEEVVLNCRFIVSMGGEEIWSQYVMSEQEPSTLLNSFLSPFLSLCHSCCFLYLSVPLFLNP